jgi:hypothetical protein
MSPPNLATPARRQTLADSESGCCCANTLKGLPAFDPSKAAAKATPAALAMASLDGSLSEPKESGLAWQANRREPGPNANTSALAEQELARIQLNWGQPSQRELEWLLRHGVTGDALVKPWPIGATTVLFDGHTFEPNASGLRAITIAVIDCDEIIDIAAWQPRSGRLGSWHGVAFCLNQDAVFNPGTYWNGGALRVHRSPLGWLKAGREGIVVLRPELCNAYLAHLQRLLFADPQFKGTVWQWMQPMRPTAELLVEPLEEAA